MLRGLSNKMEIFETESNNQRNTQAIGQRIPNQFRRSFNPHISNKVIRNENPSIEPPFRLNEAIINVLLDEYEIEPLEGINWINDDKKMIHLNENEYEITERNFFSLKKITITSLIFPTGVTYWENRIHL